MWRVFPDRITNNQYVSYALLSLAGSIHLAPLCSKQSILCNLNWKKKRYKVIINQCFFLFPFYYRSTNPNRTSLLPSRMGRCSCGRPMRWNSGAISTWWLLYGLVFLRLHCCNSFDFRMLRAFGSGWNCNVRGWYPGWNQQRKTSRLHIVINLDTAKLLYYINLFCTCMYV